MSETPMKPRRDESDGKPREPVTCAFCGRRGKNPHAADCRRRVVEGDLENGPNARDAEADYYDAEARENAAWEELSTGGHAHAHDFVLNNEVTNEYACLCGAIGFPCRGCGVVFAYLPDADYCPMCCAENAGTEVESVATCGCVAFADGTGSPCETHHPDARPVP